MTWVKVDDKLHDNDKLGAVSDSAFRLWVLALSWSNDKLTDGHIPTARPQKLLTMRKPEKTIGELLEAKLWHRASSPCVVCQRQRDEKKGDPIPAGGYVIHDYFEYQKAAWVIRAERDKRRGAGRAGAQARWGPDGTSYGKSDSKSDSTPHGKSHGKTDAVGASSHSKGYGKTDAPVPGTPVPRNPGSVRTRPVGVQGEEPEPVIPDRPARSSDRRGTGLRHVGEALTRAATGAGA